MTRDKARWVSRYGRASRTTSGRSAAPNPPALPSADDAHGSLVPEFELWGVWNDVSRTVLSAGVRVVTARLPRSGSVSIAVGIGVGSRAESDAEAGTCHVLEHMVFRGSARWPTSFDLTAAIENAGGSLDGYTHREATVYHARLPRPSMEVALDLIFDMIRRPLLKADDFAVERDVVLEEVRQDAVASSVVAEETLDALLWPGHSLNRSPGGNEKTVATLGLESLQRLWTWAYVPGRIVVSIAGDIDHQAVCDVVARLSEGWHAGGEAPTFAELPDGPTTAQLESRPGEGPTSYVYAGVRGVASTHPDRPALELLSCAVGELASSRLWADLRDARGLAYDVGSDVVTYADSGALRMWAGVPPRRQGEAVDRLLAQVAAAQRGLSAEEFERARNYVVGELTMTCETSEDMAHWLLWGELAHRRLIAPGAVRAVYRALTREDIARAADRWSLAQVQFAIAGPAPRRGARLQKAVTVAAQQAQ